MAKLITSLGPKNSDELGMILPHEHIFVETRPLNTPGYAQADVEDVLQLMVPELTKAQEVGVTAIVECSPIGGRRRADIVRMVSEASNFPLVIPTGIFCEPWIPDWAHKASESELAKWMLNELQGEIEESGVQAGWIKLGASDDGLSASETKILRAAATVGRETNAVIGSHTIKGQIAQDQLNIIETMGYAAERFIWIHTQAEPDFDLHLEIARRGAWLEYDEIGSINDNEDDEYYVQLIHRILDAGLGEHLLLSHDRGWYDPSLPAGGVPRPFTYLPNQFLPKLRASGVNETTIHQLTHINPYKAFAR